MTTIIDKPNVLSVKTFEEEVYLIQKSERDYLENGGIDTKEAYLK